MALKLLELQFVPHILKSLTQARKKNTHTHIQDKYINNQVMTYKLTLVELFRSISFKRIRFENILNHRHDVQIFQPI